MSKGHDLRTAALKQDISQIGEIVKKSSSGCYKEASSYDPFGVREILDDAIELIAEPALQSVADSFLLLSLFLSDWGQLSEEQKLRLFRQIDAHCEKFQDTTAIQVMIELLGENYADERSFLLLVRFSSSKRDEVRALSCLGIATLGRAFEIYYVRSLAILKRLFDDPSAIVKEEARIALAKIIRG